MSYKCILVKVNQKGSATVFDVKNLKKHIVISTDNRVLLANAIFDPKITKGEINTKCMLKTSGRMTKIIPLKTNGNKVTLRRSL